VQNLTQKNRGVVVKLKNPKVLTIIVLGLILLIVFIAIAALSGTKRNKPVQNLTETLIITQTALPTPTPKLSDIDLQVQDFNKQLEDNQPYSVMLKKPIVDLDLSFEK